MRLKTVDTLKTKNARDSKGSRAFCYRLESVVPLDSGNVLRLQALGPFGHVELHGLAFLQALKAPSLNRGCLAPAVNQPAADGNILSPGWDQSPAY